MIAPITSGLTPSEFIDLINNGFAGVLVEEYTSSSEAMTTGELQTNINTNLSTSLSLVGLRGSDYISKINNAFNAYGYYGDTPSSITATAVEDFIRIGFTDESGGAAQHEIWQSKAGAAYELLTTLNAGVVSYDYDCTLMLDYKFRLRSKVGSVYSTYSSIAEVGSFWPFRTDQTALTTINFRQIKLDDNPASSVTVEWGDGSSYDDYSPVGNVYDEVNHDYAETGVYWIHITGDIAKISVLQFYSQILDGTDISRWRFPDVFSFCHLMSNGFVGDFSTMIYPALAGGIHMAGNNGITGNADNFFSVERPNLWDCHLPVGGNGAGWTIPPKVAHLYNDDGLYGDISHWVFPKNMDYKSWAIYLRGTPTGDISNLFAGTYQHLHTISLINLGLSGDLSGWDIGGDYIAAASIEIYGNNFTKLPRGNFYKFGVYNCATNSCNSTEIDALLADILASVTANAPEYNCIYTLNGIGMGIPSATGLTAKGNIETKYTDAGKTISILVNS